MSKEIYTKKANLLKALGHPLRLQILDILNNEKITVSELCERLGEQQANISRHLSILRKEEVIDYTKTGVNTYYKIKYKCLNSLDVCLDQIMKNRLQVDIDTFKSL